MTTHPTDTPLGTPRTDACKAAHEYKSPSKKEWEMHARTLEKELNEATALLRQKDEALLDAGLNSWRDPRFLQTVMVNEAKWNALMALTPKSPTP